MFSLPKGEDTDSTSLPVVDIDEDAETTSSMLSLCYPGIEDRVPETLESMHRLLCALRKYDMEVPLGKMGRAIESTFIKASPARVFAIAYHVKMGDLALAAARECLKWTMTGLVTSDIPELEHIPATAFHDLLRYHEECRVVAPKVAAWTSVKSWDSRIESRIWFMCSSCTVGSYALGAGRTGKYARIGGVNTYRVLLHLWPFRQQARLQVISLFNSNACKGLALVLCAPQLVCCIWRLLQPSLLIASTLKRHGLNYA